MKLRELWILGDPVSQSRSPVMHNAAYAQMGLDWSYGARRVPPEQLGQALDDLRREEALGGSLTIPHKELVLPLLYSSSERVRAIGAANTLRLSPQGWEGDNTDGPGWLDSWDEEIGQSLEGRPAIILGAGGAARAILWALQSRGIGDLVVLNRSPERAARLGVRSASLSRFAELLRPATVVVQTTSVGMWPEADAAPVEWPLDLPPGLVACDLIYNPSPTLFLREAAARGAACLDGRGMLVHQAARAIRWWSGREDIPTELMRKVLVKSLSPGAEEKP